MISSDRRVMYNSCNRMPLMRSNIDVTPCNFQEYVLERRFLHLDVGDPHPALAESEDQLGNPLLRRIDYYRVVLGETKAPRPRRQERRHGVAVALDREAELRRGDPLGESERRVLRED